MTRVHWVEPPFKIPEKVSAGDLIRIEATKQVASVRLNGVDFVPLPNGTYLAGTGSNGKKRLTVHGMMPQSDSFFDYYPEIKAFRRTVAVQYPRTRRSKIKLPKDVQRRLASAPDEVIAKERATMRSLLAQWDDKPRLECWKKPLNSRVVSKFASPRTLPSGHQYFHSGLDMRAAKGTPIRAPAGGKVLFASHMTVPGNTVVLDHGGGIVSRYMHLDVIKVQSGGEIRAGEILGLSGATGRVEAPHLHWEVLLRGIPVDPLRFLQAWEQLCDQA